MATFIEKNTELLKKNARDKIFARQQLQNGDAGSDGTGMPQAAGGIEMDGNDYLRGLSGYGFQPWMSQPGNYSDIGLQSQTGFGNDWDKPYTPPRYIMGDNEKAPETLNEWQAFARKNGMKSFYFNDEKYSFNGKEGPASLVTNPRNDPASKEYQERNSTKNGIGELATPTVKGKGFNPFAPEGSPLRKNSAYYNENTTSNISKSKKQEVAKGLSNTKESSNQLALLSDPNYNESSEKFLRTQHYANRRDFSFNNGVQYPGIQKPFVEPPINMATDPRFGQFNNVQEGKFANQADVDALQKYEQKNYYNINQPAPTEDSASVYANWQNSQNKVNPLNPVPDKVDLGLPSFEEASNYAPSNKTWKEKGKPEMVNRDFGIKGNNKVSTPGNPSGPINWGKVGTFAGQTAPLIYNMIKGLQKPEKTRPNYNPYESQIRSTMANRRFNIEPLLNSNLTAQAVANRNIQNAGNSRGELMSNFGAAQNYRMIGDASAWATKNNMDNQYLEEQARMDYMLGQGRSQMDWNVQDANARNKAATNQFMGQGFNDLGKFSQMQQLMGNQMNRDSQLVGLYPDMFGVYNYMNGAKEIVNSTKNQKPFSFRN